MQELPLVTVICLCYNHEKFVEESINSVLQQTYPNVEIILVNDGSNDKSTEIILKIARDNNLKYLNLPVNQGNCIAFNKGFALAKGEFIIDLATDDVLEKTRIEEQVDFFNGLSQQEGVIFSNATIIDVNGKLIGFHYPVDASGKSEFKIKDGNIFTELLSSFFIAAPTMMIRRHVLDQLKGYDEELAYEDFDFWVRSARHFKYKYQDKVLTRIRKTPESLSSRSYEPGDKQLHSTYLVCLKAKSMIQNSAEQKAWLQRIRFELRQAVFSNNHKEARMFIELLKAEKSLGFTDSILSMINRMKWNLSWIREVYLKIRY